MTTIEMSNYLFFRTDRIGDFLVSAILINSIKRNDLNSNITVVSSKKNHLYIKSIATGSNCTDSAAAIASHTSSWLQKFGSI